MPEGYVAWAVSLFVLTTLLWAAVWWWLPAIFKDRDREPPDAPARRDGPGDRERRDRARDTGSGPRS